MILFCSLLQGAAPAEEVLQRRQPAPAPAPPATPSPAVAPAAAVSETRKTPAVAPAAAVSATPAPAAGGSVMAPPKRTHRCPDGTWMTKEEVDARAKELREHGKFDFVDMPGLDVSSGLGLVLWLVEWLRLEDLCVFLLTAPMFSLFSVCRSWS